MMRAASVVFGLLAVGLLGYAGYRYAVDREGPPPGEALALVEPDLDLGPQPRAQALTVCLRVTNRLAQPVRVVGLAPG